LILDRVSLWFDSKEAASNWYENQKLPSWGLTPEMLLKKHGIETLNTYISEKEEGVFE